MSPASRESMKFLIGVAIFPRLVGAQARQWSVAVGAPSRAEAMGEVMTALEKIGEVERWEGAEVRATFPDDGEVVHFALNGKPMKRTRGRVVTYEELVVLAGFEGIAVTVTWARRGAMGSMGPGVELVPSEGMAFFAEPRS